MITSEEKLRRIRQLYGDTIWKMLGMKKPKDDLVGAIDDLTNIVGGFFNQLEIILAEPEVTSISGNGETK